MLRIEGEIRALLKCRNFDKDARRRETCISEGFSYIRSAIGGKLHVIPDCTEDFPHTGGCRMPAESIMGRGSTSTHRILCLFQYRQIPTSSMMDVVPWNPQWLWICPKIRCHAGGSLLVSAVGRLGTQHQPDSACGGKVLLWVACMTLTLTLTPGLLCARTLRAHVKGPVTETAHLQNTRLALLAAESLPRDGCPFLRFLWMWALGSLHTLTQLPAELSPSSPSHQSTWFSQPQTTESRVNNLTAVYAGHSFWLFLHRE